jgi:two-component system sensor histidine kinase UhpB
MNLKLRLNIIITALLAMVMLIGALFMVRNAREDVRAEVQSTTTLALHLLDTEILHYANGYQWLDSTDNHEYPVFRLKSLNNVRHLRIEFFDAHGHLRESNHPPREPKGNIPAWFLGLMNIVSPVMQPTHRPIIVNQRLLGELVVTPDSTYEIDEIWGDILNLLILVAVFFVVVNAMVYWAVGRALRPVARISVALADLEQGHWESRLPHFKLPELSSISDKFNAMAGTLQTSVRNNHKLTQQIITLQEEERKNLARDLHDEIGQHLTAIHVDAAAILKAKSLAEARESADAINEVSRQMMDIVHDMLQRLQPIALEELGLNAALREHIDSWQQRNQNITATASIDAQADVPDVIAITVYRIVQECLTNITRHAQAGNVTISLSCLDSKLAIRVQDDGKGFDTETPPEGFGLAGMRERVEALGGLFEIHSDIGHGVTVSVVLPLIRETS